MTLFSSENCYFFFFLPELNPAIVVLFSDVQKREKQNRYTTSTYRSNNYITVHNTTAVLLYGMEPQDCARGAYSQTSRKAVFVECNKKRTDVDILPDRFRSTSD